MRVRRRRHHTRHNVDDITLHVHDLFLIEKENKQ